MNSKERLLVKIIALSHTSGRDRLGSILYICLVFEARHLHGYLLGDILSVPYCFQGHCFGNEECDGETVLVLAPVICSLAEDNFMYIFRRLGVGCALICFLLSETKDSAMKDTAEQEREKGFYLLGMKLRMRKKKRDKRVS